MSGLRRSLRFQSQRFSDFRFSYFEHTKWEHPHYLFIMLCLSATDVLNMSDHTHEMFEGGGFSFVLIEILIYIVVSIPLVMMEVQHGQYFGQSNTKIFWNICPIAGGVGFAQLMNLFFYLIKGAVILSWLFNYFFAAFSYTAPWYDCGHKWNKPGCFTKHQFVSCVEQRKQYYNGSCVEPEDYCKVYNMTLVSATSCTSEYVNHTMTDLFGINYTNPGKDYYTYVFRSPFGSGISDAYLLSNYTVAWILTFLCVYKGINGFCIALSHLVLAVSSIVLLIMLFFSVITDGGWFGVRLGMQPNITIFNKGLLNFKTWSTAVVETIDVNQIGYGIHPFLGSMNQIDARFYISVFLSSVYIFFYNHFFSLLVYAMSGTSNRQSFRGEYNYMIKNLSEPLSIVREAPSLFNFYAKPRVWCFGLFTVLCAKTITCNFITLECIVNSLIDAIPAVNVLSKPIICFLISFFGWIIGLFFFIDNPMQLVENFYRFVKLSVQVLTIVQVIVYTFIYGFASGIKNSHFKNLNEMIGWHQRFYYYLRITYYVTVPIFLVIFAIECVWSMKFPIDYFWTAILGVMYLIICIIIIGVGAAIQYWIASTKQMTFQSLLRPSSKWRAQYVAIQLPFKSKHAKDTWQYNLDKLLNKVGLKR